MATAPLSGPESGKIDEDFNLAIQLSLQEKELEEKKRQELAAMNVPYFNLTNEFRRQTKKLRLLQPLQLL